MSCFIWLLRGKGCTATMSKTSQKCISFSLFAISRSWLHISCWSVHMVTHFALWIRNIHFESHGQIAHPKLDTDRQFPKGVWSCHYKNNHHNLELWVQYQVYYGNDNLLLVFIWGKSVFYNNFNPTSELLTATQIWLLHWPYENYL